MEHYAAIKRVFNNLENAYDIMVSEKDIHCQLGKKICTHTHKTKRKYAHWLPLSERLNN